MKDDKLRIAYLMHGIFYGGATRSLFLLLKSINHYELEKYILTLPSRSEEIKNDIIKYADYYKEIKLPSIAYNQVYHTSWYKVLLYVNYKYKKFVDHLKFLKIDILHINTSVFPQILNAVKKYSNIKTVTHVREHICYSKTTWIQKYIIIQIKNYSDAIIAISDNEAEVFQSHKNLYILPNPFDFSKTKNIKSTFRRDHNIRSDTIMVAMFSHFISQKGHLDFIEAINILINKMKIGENVLFLIVGVKEKRSLIKLIIKKILFIKDLRKQIDKKMYNYNLLNHIKLIPFTNNVFNIINTVDIVVRPSETGDPWGRDIIEAMAFKKPVVATGSSEFYVNHNRTGFLVKPKNPNDLALNILDLINHKDKREDFGKRGYEKINGMCTLGKYGEKIIEIYNQLV